MEAPTIFDANNIYELEKTIEEKHREMLEAESLEEKEESLRQLRGYISQYLYLTPHRSKFKLEETGKVLSQSVQAVDDFDPREALEAFENLAKYSHNLLEQPWRKEFHRISLVSGFFLHNIRAQLRDPQDMLLLLGYVGTDDHTLQLHRLADEDILHAFSRDCFVASHECLILSQIWERVQREVPNHPLTLLEAWEARKAYAGNVDSVCENLLVQARKRVYEIEEAEREHRKRQEHERFQQVLAKAELAPPPEVPVDNTLIELEDEQNEDVIVKNVLQNTKKYDPDPSKKKPQHPSSKYQSQNTSDNSVQRGLGGQPQYLSSTSEQFKSGNSVGAVKGYANGFQDRAADYYGPCQSVAVNKQAQDQAEELDKLVYQKFIAGDVPSGYRPTGNQRIIDQREAQWDSEPVYMPLMPPTPPRSIGSQEKVSPSIAPANFSSGFKSLSRKQDLPKLSSFVENEKKPSAGEKIHTLLKGGKTSKATKEKDSSRTKKHEREEEKQLSSTSAGGDSRNRIVPIPGVFPLERSKIPNPDLASSMNVSPNTNSSNTIKLYSDKLIDEAYKIPDKMEFDYVNEDEVPKPEENSVFEETIGSANRNGVEEEGWNCKFCTYKNEAPHRICVMCSKSKDLPIEGV